jgi:hypothetical protein
MPMMYLTLAVGLTVVPAVAGAETVLGVRGGATSASVDLEDAYPGIEYSNRDGFMVGVSAAVSLNEWCWLRLEPSFVQKGVVVDWPAGADSLDNTQEYDYLMVPIHAKAVAGAGTVRPFGVAGLSVGFVLNEETVLDSGEPYPDTDLIEDVDFTLDFGGGVDIRAGSRAVVVVEGRYALGLIDISPQFVTSATRSRTWMIMGGIDFRL